MGRPTKYGARPSLAHSSLSSVLFLLYFAPRFELHGPKENPPQIEIKQSKRPKKSKNQIPLPSHSSHPTPKWNQNNQNTGIVPVNITMQVIASVEKYENAGMKFSTVPAFALAESRASDACCLFLGPLPIVVQKHTRAKSACFGINCRRGDAQPRPTSCDPCRSRAQPAGRRPCSLAVMRAS